MAMRFSILGSGSSGNAALLMTDETRVLVDAGFSARKLNSLLAAVGESLDRIHAVFLSHEHSDHCAGIEGLKKYPHIKIFANAATAGAVQSCLDHRPDWQVFNTGTTFRFRDLEIRSFAVPHDAQEPVGFRFACGHEDDLFTPRRELTYLTDLGHAPMHIREHIRGCHILVVESNHCPELLKNDPKRPWALKQRIGGRHGHLSNAATCALLAEVACPQWRRIFLTHLSRDCNSRTAVETAFAPLRTTLARCEFSIIEQGQSTPLYDCV